MNYTELKPSDEWMDERCGWKQPNSPPPTPPHTPAYMSFIFHVRSLEIILAGAERRTALREPAEARPKEQTIKGELERDCFLQF